MTIAELYVHQYKTLAADSPSRFIVFEPIDRTGWGNRLRGLTLCLLMAVATNRILILKDFLLEENFEPLPGTLWRFRDWRRVLGSRWADARELVLHLQPSNWNQEEWERYGSEPMSALFPEDILVLRESIGFFDQLVRNPHHAELWKSLGLQTDSKIRWLGQVVEPFLARPRPRLRRFAETLTKGLGSPPPTILVQFRTFYDIGSPQRSLLNEFIDETAKLLLENPGQAVYVATDSDEATAIVSAALSRVARVIPSRTKVVHTGELHNGWEKTAEKILRKVLHRDFFFLDFWFWLPESWRPRPHTAVLAEWLYYGTCSVVVSTFTSFTVYAMARTGNRASLYRFDPERKVVEPLSDQHYFF